MITGLKLVHVSLVKTSGRVNGQMKFIIFETKEKGLIQKPNKLIELSQVYSQFRGGRLWVNPADKVAANTFTDLLFVTNARSFE